MKQRLLLFVSTLVFSIVFANSASAYDVEVGGLKYEINPKAKTAEVISKNDKYEGEIVIPESIIVDNDNYSVTSIGEKAFCSCNLLTSVTIPNSVLSIGEYAFQDCNNLTSFKIPNSITKIEYGVFTGCRKLKSITIPNSVTSIGADAFHDCISLKSITIPNSVTSIGTGAFRGCSSLENPIIVNDMFVKLPNGYSGHYSIPNNITQIIGEAFAYCKSLTSITIPESVINIGNGAFEYCEGLTSITIPESVINIGNGAFEYCEGLTSITIPNSVTDIGAWTFSNSGLTSITIPNSVTCLKVGLFEFCSSLSSVTIPNTVNTIESWVFQDCTNLKAINIPNSVTTIEPGVFQDCTNLETIIIPNSVTIIRSSAFLNCSGLISVTIPNTVQFIEEYAFKNCQKLESVYCYAKDVPSTHYNAFEDSYIDYATLYVPSESIEKYKKASPWSGFGTIKTLEGDEVETKKCETPTISYSNGNLSFSCATEDVVYASEINSEDVKKYYTDKVSLSACYNISVKATKIGYEDSDLATAKLYWLPTDGTLETNINTAKTRGVMATSSDGFVTISGLNTNEIVIFYSTDGKELGAVKAIDGSAQFAAQSGSVVVAKIGDESLKIAVK